MKRMRHKKSWLCLVVMMAALIFGSTCNSVNAYAQENAVLAEEAALEPELPMAVPEESQAEESRESESESASESESQQESESPKETESESQKETEKVPETKPIKIKAHWEGNKYIKSDGTYATGSYQIKDVYYIFKKNGELATSKKGSVVKVNSKYYMADPDGKALKGWQIIKGNLYYGASSGKCKMNTTYMGFKFNEKATMKSPNSARVKAKMEALKIYKSITKPSMKKSEKLKACWNYVVSDTRFRYVSKYPDLKKKTWIYSTAYDMLTTKKGNCYSFACAFAALANECGYDPYVVCGRVAGNRDHASDGLTRHSWVQIKERHYDPEGYFAHWMNCYNSKTYNRRHTIQQTVRYNPYMS